MLVRRHLSFRGITLSIVSWCLMSKYLFQHLLWWPGNDVHKSFLTLCQLINSMKNSSTEFGGNFQHWKPLVLSLMSVALPSTIHSFTHPFVTYTFNSCPILSCRLENRFSPNPRIPSGPCGFHFGILYNIQNPMILMFACCGTYCRLG